jgi:hypothetical protein
MGMPTQTICNEMQMAHTVHAPWQPDQELQMHSASASWAGSQIQLVHATRKLQMSGPPHASGQRTKGPGYCLGLQLKLKLYHVMPSEQVTGFAFWAGPTASEHDKQALTCN